MSEREAEKARGDDALSEKGRRRREALLEATLRIIVRDGPGAATLRAVVKEAGASHGLVMYYFGSREELIRAALALVAQRNIAALREAWADMKTTSRSVIAAQIARHSMRQMIEDSSMGITIVELHLAAARHPDLRPALRDWGRAYARISRDVFVGLGSTSPGTHAAMLINLINGLVLRQLAIPRADFEAKILLPSIEAMLQAVGGGDGGGKRRRDQR